MQQDLKFVSFCHLFVDYRSLDTAHGKMVEITSGSAKVCSFLYGKVGAKPNRYSHYRRYEICLLPLLL
jgi:hypothetical protein